MTNVIETAGESREREYKVAFSEQVHPAVVAKAIAAYNEELSVRFGGVCFFPEQTEMEVSGGETIHVSHLVADDAGWDAFCNRKESLMPYVSHRLKQLVAKPTTVAPVGDCINRLAA